MKELIELNDAGWYWPKLDAKGWGGAWDDLSQNFSDTPRKISELVSNRKIIVQAGGNCGLYVKKYAELFDHVYTFEPDPVNFFCLNLNVTEINVHKFQAALGVSRGLVQIQVNREFPNNVGGYHVNQDEGFIPTLQIDDLGLSGCDVIHLDIEGYEKFALMGAVNTIKKFNPIIVLEYCEPWSARYGISDHDINSYMDSLGYDNFGVIAGTQGDCLYKPKQI